MELDMLAELSDDLDAIYGATPTAVATTAPAPAKPRLRVHAGATITDTMMKQALGIETTAQKLERWAESKRDQHVVGDTCPHCAGTGRYRLHTDATSNGKCYRCDGKGVINAKDLAFLARRTKGNEPICWITSAAA